jgi:hypothetical protein
MKTQKGKVSGWLLVRDSEGNVKFDDWDNIPEAYHKDLTKADWAYIHKQRGK